MPISLTCTCGQRQLVANERAGQTVPCVACGKALSVPAMGRLVGVTAKRQAKRSSRAPTQLLAIFAIVGVLMLVSGGGWLAWAFNRVGPAEPTPVAQHRIIEPLPERRPPEPEKKDAPKAIVEPAPIKDPPKIVAQPAEPKDEPQPRPEAVKPKEPVVEKKPPAVEKPPPNVLEPLRLVWKLKEGDRFFQELIVTQKPIFKMQGVLVASALQYQIVSRFTVKKANEDGSWIVEQKIVAAKLVQADDLTKSTLAGAVTQLPGATYTLNLSPKMEVTKFAGAVGGVKMGGLNLGLQMASLIDRDGWKELAQATFFQMDQPLKINQRWTKPLTHNWGALGSWHGVSNYAYLGQQGLLHKIAYGLQLTYKAPAGGAVGLLAINGANFQAPEAGGVLLFDAGKGKVVRAEERFRVKGVINANLLGQNTVIEIAEDQHFLIRIHDKLPQ